MKSLDGFMFIENRFIMDKIVKKDGYVYLVQEHDAYGIHKTITNLGKDPDDPRWEEEIEIPKQKREKTKKDED